MDEKRFPPQELETRIEGAVGAVFKDAEPMLEIGITRDWNTDRQTVETALEFSVARDDIASAIALVESVRSATTYERAELASVEEGLQLLSLQVQTLERKRATATTRKGKDTRRFQQQIEEDIVRLNEKHLEQSGRAVHLRERASDLLEQYSYFTSYLFFLKALAAHRAGESIEDAMQTADQEEEKIAAPLRAFFKQQKTFDDSRISPLSPRDIQQLIDRRGFTSPVAEEIAVDRRAQQAVERLKTQCRAVVAEARRSGYPEFITITDPVSFATERTMRGNPSREEIARALALHRAYETRLTDTMAECISRCSPFLGTLSPGARMQYENVMASVAHGFSRSASGCDTAVPRPDEMYYIGPADKLLLDIAEYELQNDARIPAAISERSYQGERHLSLDRVPPPPSSRKKGMELVPFSNSINILSHPKHIFALPAIGQYYPHLLSESVSVKVERIIDQAGGMPAVMESLHQQQSLNHALTDHLNDVYSFVRRLIQLTFDNRMEARALIVPEHARNQFMAILKRRLSRRPRTIDGQHKEVREYVVEYVESLQDRIQFYAHGARILPVLPDANGVPKIVNVFLGVPFHRALMYLLTERIMSAVMGQYIDITFDGLRLPSLDFSKRSEFLRNLKTVAQALYCGPNTKEQFQQFVAFNTPDEGERDSLPLGKVDIESFPRSIQELDTLLGALREIGYNLTERREDESRVWGDLLQNIISGELMQLLLEWKL